MGSKEEEFLKRLRATFRIEAEERLKAISAGLIELEKQPPAGAAREIIEDVYRAAHSLKGAARSVNLTDAEKLCHSMENVFAAWKRQDVPQGAGVFDILHNVIDYLHAGILSSEGESAGAASPPEALIRELENAVSVSGLLGAATGKRVEAPERKAAEPPAAKEAPAPPPDPMAPISDTIRISASRLTSLLGQAEELLSAKLAAGERAKELAALSAAMQARRRKWEAGAPEAREELATLEHELKNAATAVEQDYRKLAGMIDGLLEDMKRALMLPFASLLEILPKLTRDLARSQGKEAEVVIEGAGIEVDRRLLDEMKDPLLHIIRNCVSHGIETPEIRRRKGKAPKGTITVTVTQKDAGRVELSVSDDGAGLDLAALKSAALKAGALSPHEAETISERELITLAFHSGVSTSPLITDVSGRGLGLAIVQETVERLGGALEIESRPDHGAVFRIVSPITLASFRGVLVRVGDHTLVFPTLSVERVVRAAPDAIQTIENRQAIRVNGAAVPLVRLEDALELPRRPHSRKGVCVPHAVILRSAAGRVAFLVDETLGEQEVMVKSLGRQLARVRHIAGAAVLGSGMVAPIVNVRDILKAAGRAPGAPLQAAPATRGEPATPKRILLAEDSITARALLKSILETAGYAVRTAADGAEALAIARTEDIDLVVSDVEMPRMNGFELTAKIRADKKLAELPVALVTALESREDRERGIEAGANAYLVKSSFDQNNLLDVIRRLL